MKKHSAPSAGPPPRLNRLLLTGAAFLGLVGLQTGASEGNAHLRENAQEENRQVITECRDAVLCTLAKIHQLHDSAISSQKNQMAYNVIDTMQLGGHECKLVQSSAGFGIVAGDRFHLVGPTKNHLSIAVEAVKNELNSRRMIGQVFTKSHTG